MRSPSPSRADRAAGALHPQDAFVRDQLAAMEEGLLPSKFFDVPTLLRQCTFCGHAEYTAVGDMLARVLRAMRPVKFDREGFHLFCDEVQPPPPASPPLPLGQRP